MAVKITHSKGYELLEGGVFLTAGDGETKLTISYNNDALTVIFVFIENAADARPLTKMDVLDLSTLKIILTNYSSPLGTYNKELFEIGTIANVKLFLTFVVRGLQHTDRKQITYSFYLKPEVVHG